jgi:hypothetical protein
VNRKIATVSGRPVSVLALFEKLNKNLSSPIAVFVAQVEEIMIIRWQDRRILETAQKRTNSWVRMNGTQVPAGTGQE